jgi:hypothetical protein
MFSVKFADGTKGLQEIQTESDRDKMQKVRDLPTKLADEWVAWLSMWENNQ